MDRGATVHEVAELTTERLSTAQDLYQNPLTEVRALLVFQRHMSSFFYRSEN